MVIRLYTDTPFYNDIAEELRLFGAAVQQAQDPCDADVRVLLGGAYARASGRVAGQYASYAYRRPRVTGSALVVKRYAKRAVKIAAFRMMQRFSPDAPTPWGSLTGIRPTALYRELLGENSAAADEIMRSTFDVSEEKLALCKTITAVQRPILATLTPRDLDVYIGVPFCRTRCLYCSFASEVRTPKTDMAAYLAALKADIRMGAALMREGGYRLRALYMGGGTPTVLTAGELADLLACALEAYGGLGAECTVEAGRPDTIDRVKLTLLRDLGVRRVSINPQTMNEDTLVRVGRSHTPADIRAAFELAREIGFESVNMDVIAGLPGEDAAAMARTLTAIEAMAPDNLTVHTLAIKRSSRLHQYLTEYPLPDAATAQAMVRMGAQSAARMGMQPYYMYRQKYMSGNLENVGYALPGRACVYNVDMMEDVASVMAHGAGAMSKRIFGGEHRVERIPNPKDIAAYIAKLDALGQAKRALFLAP